MYNVTVLPSGAKTPSGKDPINIDPQELEGLAVVKTVLPVELVTEFDTWLSDSLKPKYIERPTLVIEEYLDLMGHWAGIEGLQVVYYLAVDPDSLEKIEQFASQYDDLR